MSKFSRLMAGVFTGLLLSFNLQAGDKIAVNPNHPDRYVVQAGDTLWDIAARFLEAPWRWPEVWQYNPQIPDPHLIYPGDAIALSFDANGKPILSLERNGRSAIKLSPKVRIEELTQPIPTIPLDAIRPFLTRPYVVDPGSLDTAPYVLGFAQEHIVASTGQKIYIRDSARSLTEPKYHVVRPGKLYKHADSGRVLGQEALYVGEALTLRHNDPATAQVLQSDLEILAGDRLIPMSEDRPLTQFTPKPPSGNPHCSIISVLNGVTQIGQYNVIALDCGENKGLEQGDVMSIDQRGKTVSDPYYVDEEAPERRSRQMIEFFDEEREYPKVEKYVIPDPAGKVTLPDEPVGTLMIFRVFPRVSFALVLKAADAIHVLDRVRTPDLY